MVKKLLHLITKLYGVNSKYFITYEEIILSILLLVLYLLNSLYLTMVTTI